MSAQKQEQPESKTIYQRLSAVQQELKAPKNQYNSFGKYNYRSAEDILEGLKPVLSKHGLTLVISDEVVYIGERFYIKATATIFDFEGTTLSASALARESDEKKGMDESQISGTASSYARKYAMNGLFNIDDTKDADTDEHRKQQASAPQKTAPKKAAATMQYKEPEDTPDGECEVCHKHVDGKNVYWSQRKHRKTLCWDCRQKAEKGELNDPKNNIVQEDPTAELDRHFKGAVEEEPTIPCEVPGCKNTIRKQAEKRNRQGHNGHVVCKEHHDDDTWQEAFGETPMEEDIDPATLPI